MTVTAFEFTEREQVVLMAALQRHWAANTEGAGHASTEASDEVASLMTRLHAEGIASFLVGSQNRPDNREFGGSAE